MSRVGEQLFSSARHARCLCTADACGMPGNYVVGANVAAFIWVADAMLTLGMV